MPAPKNMAKISKKADLRVTGQQFSVSGFGIRVLLPDSGLPELIYWFGLVVSGSTRSASGFEFRSAVIESGITDFPTTLLAQQRGEIRHPDKFFL